MIRDASDTVAFTFSVSRGRGEVGMERGKDSGIKNRRAVFGAEDDVDEKK